MEVSMREKLQGLTGYVVKIEVPGDGSMSITLELPDRTFAVLRLAGMVKMHSTRGGFQVAPGLQYQWNHPVAAPDDVVESVEDLA